MSLALQRNSVASVMQRSLCTTPPQMTADQAKLLLKENTQWYVVIDDANRPITLIAGVDMIDHLEKNIGNNTVYLLDGSLAMQPLTALNIQATLKQALNKMDDNKVNAPFCIGLYIRKLSRQWYSDPRRYRTIL